MKQNYQYKQQYNSSPPTTSRLGRFGLVLLAVAFGLLISSRQAYVASLSYEIADLQDQVATLDADVERMRFEVAKLKSIDRIEHIATGELGMIRPEVIRLVVVPKSDKPVAVIASAGSVEDDSRRAGSLVAEIAARFIPVLGRAEAGTRASQ